MKFVGFKYKKYSFPLKNPLKISNQSITHKDVIIIKAEDDMGDFHYGEVAPLPGFSKENIEDCEQLLKELLSESQQIEIDALKNRLVGFNNYPSLLFALEQLVLSCEINKSDLTEREVKTNRLIGLDSKEIVILKVREFVDAGFEILKLKIGRPDFMDDLEIIKSLQKEFGYKIRLRLDNNGIWNISEAVRNIKLLTEFNIEYIEQPVNNIEDLQVLAEKSPIPIAADESIRNFDDVVKLINNEMIKYLVLKPTIRLGIFNTLKTIKLANEAGVNIIISSAFETAIGRNTLIYLSSIVHKNTAHGLNTELVGSNNIKTNIDCSLPKISYKYSDLFSTQVLDLL